MGMRIFGQSGPVRRLDDDLLLCLTLALALTLTFSLSLYLFLFLFLSLFLSPLLLLLYGMIARLLCRNKGTLSKEKNLSKNTKTRPAKIAERFSLALFLVNANLNVFLFTLVDHIFCAM